MTPRNLGDILRANAEAEPDATAFVFADGTVTFAAHRMRGERLAAALGAIGLGRGDRVAVLSRNGREFMEVYAAAELGNVTVATINFRLAAPEIARVVADSTPRVLFFETVYASQVERLRPLGIVERFVAIGRGVPDWAIPYEDFVASGEGRPLPAPAAPDDIAHLIYTSGSTGMPKGVMRPHRAEIAVSEHFATVLGVERADRMQLMMPVFHVGARFLQMGAHYRRATCFIHAEFDPAAILAGIERDRITITHLAPTMVKALLDVPDVERFDLASLKAIVYSGAPMPVPLLEKGLRIFGPVFLQLYGMSEGSATALRQSEHGTGTAADRRLLASVGRPAAGVVLRVADSDDRPLGVGEVGEIQTRTPTLLAGYWNNERATAETLRGGWYHTGDMGRVDEDGYVYLVDRAKDMIISGGENIYSREVEAAIDEHPAVEDVAVIGIPDEHWGESVLALVVTRDPALTAGDIIAHCKARIASYKKPKAVRFVAELPRLPSGKVNKVALRAEHSTA
jgi:acyl-CoA synthetase (AMP-forming)/AMP-acid ligase II